MRSFELVRQYIGETTTHTGLKVRAHLVSQHYDMGIKVSEAEMAQLDLWQHEVCPQWNDTIYSRSGSLDPGGLGEVILL